MKVIIVKTKIEAAKFIALFISNSRINTSYHILET